MEDAKIEMMMPPKKEQVQASCLSVLLDCPNCFDGMEFDYDMYGSWEKPCRMCDGTGKLNKVQSKNLREFRIAYWKKKKEV